MKKKLHGVDAAICLRIVSFPTQRKKLDFAFPNNYLGILNFWAICEIAISRWHEIWIETKSHRKYFNIGFRSQVIKPILLRQRYAGDMYGSKVTMKKTCVFSRRVLHLLMEEVLHHFWCSKTEQKLRDQLPTSTGACRIIPSTTSCCRRRRHDCNTWTSQAIWFRQSPRMIRSKKDGQLQKKRRCVYQHQLTMVLPLGYGRWVEIPPICVSVSQPWIVDGWSTTWGDLVILRASDDGREAALKCGYGPGFSNEEFPWKYTLQETNIVPENRPKLPQKEMNHLQAIDFQWVNLLLVFWEGNSTKMRSNFCSIEFIHTIGNTMILDLSRCRSQSVFHHQGNGMLYFRASFPSRNMRKKNMWLWWVFPAFVMFLMSRFLTEDFRCKDLSRLGIWGVVSDESHNGQQPILWRRSFSMVSWQRARKAGNTRQPCAPRGIVPSETVISSTLEKNHKVTWRCSIWWTSKWYSKN